MKSSGLRSEGTCFYPPGETMARRIITISGDEDEMIIHVHKILELVYTQHRDEFLAHAVEAGWTLDQEAAVGDVETLLKVVGSEDDRARHNSKKPMKSSASGSEATLTEANCHVPARNANVGFGE
jgi:hypothetical protein